MKSSPIKAKHSKDIKKQAKPEFNWIVEFKAVVELHPPLTEIYS